MFKILTLVSSCLLYIHFIFCMFGFLCFVIVYLNVFHVHMKTKNCCFDLNKAIFAVAQKDVVVLALNRLLVHIDHPSKRRARVTDWQINFILQTHK